MEGLLARNGGGGAYVIGTALSAADLCLWDIIDLHLRIFGDELRASVRGAGQGGGSGAVRHHRCRRDAVRLLLC